MKFIVDNWMLILIAVSSGAMLAWPLIRGTGGGSLTAQGAVQLINRERAVMIDVRDAAEYAAGHATGARNVPLDQLEQKLPGTVKNKSVPVLLMCATGARAQRALATAKKLGYEQAQVVGGGLKSWKDANLPIEKA
ncbi:rhodanese-like domain-containing protein [Variovorax arabinosiphilus]|uniref:rhodanese-like domain-containing protein n=1 Tax=Variovorax arabinosiphilus TaxID=3053498 RepID=UPI0025779C9F|nr:MULTISPECIES: rhodanese-like domain-containing protein [unclassified Variovorax]MDM0120469.1 rhodanese-like domain-containing protein [Variovorax sp. J2L1-78]MDM0127619.1 rhodanese-like domain-containing protein [Variovorax sp. J2L1-63]MDM0231318.1 rhodanese-like domain-containing protein [Variovorax sp. J2R1-6]